MQFCDALTNVNCQVNTFLSWSKVSLTIKDN